MNDDELVLLQTLLLKLKKVQPSLTVMISEIDEEEEHRLTHNSEVFHCDLLCQIEMCLDDELNDILR